MINDNFEAKQAYHAKQVAYEKMTESREAALDLRRQQDEKYQEIADLQAEYDRVCKAIDEEWAAYNAKQLDFKNRIAAVISQVEKCNELEAEMLAKSKTLQTTASEPHTKSQSFQNSASEMNTSSDSEIYLAAAKFFSSLAKEKVVERDKLIAKKRAVTRPDNSVRDNLLWQLKHARSEHAELLEEYHHAKNEFNLDKVKFDRLNEKYKSLSDPNNTGELLTATSRPKKLEIDEKLLIENGIADKYLHDYVAERRIDGIIDIYYARTLGDGHGHLVLNPDLTVNYHRKPVA